MPCRWSRILFFFESSGAHRDLHSFPTRRSSDLRVLPLPAGEARADARLRQRPPPRVEGRDVLVPRARLDQVARSEEHTSELQSQFHLVCRLLLEKKNYKIAVTVLANISHFNDND